MTVILLCDMLNFRALVDRRRLQNEWLLGCVAWVHMMAKSFRAGLLSGIIVLASLHIYSKASALDVLYVDRYVVTDLQYYNDRSVAGLKGGKANDCCEDWGYIRIESRFQNGASTGNYAEGTGGLLPFAFGHASLTGYSRCRDDVPFPTTEASLKCWRRV